MRTLTFFLLFLASGSTAAQEKNQAALDRYIAESFHRYWGPERATAQRRLAALTNDTRHGAEYTDETIRIIRQDYEKILGEVSEARKQIAQIEELRDRQRKLVRKIAAESEWNRYTFESIRDLCCALRSPKSP